MSDSEIRNKNIDEATDKRARELSERLLLSAGEERLTYTSERLEIYTADVEADVARFGTQLRFCSTNKFPFPCLRIRDGEPLPFDWAFGNDLSAYDYRYDEELYYLFYRPWHRDWMYRTAEVFSGESKIQITEENPSKAKGFFKNRLVRFLTSRFQSAKPKQSRTRGLSFKVITSTTGLRVHYSPAYFFNTNRVFGSPTSPVTGYIHPGRYIFGVAGGSLPKPKFSDAEFDIPPAKRADLKEL